MPTYTTFSPAETRRLGRATAATLRGGTILALEGTYGSGKTTFVRGLARGFGIMRTVRSPSFLLMHQFTLHTKGIGRFVHVDLWRARRLTADDRAALHDVFSDPHAVVAVEWPDRLPRPYRRFIDIACTFRVLGLRRRRVIIQRERTLRS